MLTGKEKRAGHDAAHRASGLTQTVGMIAPPCGPPIGGRPLRQGAGTMHHIVLRALPCGALRQSTAKATSR